MLKIKLKWLALLGSAALCTTCALAQDSGPLIDLLVRKGLVNDQEAEDLRADLANQNATALVSTSKGNFLEKVTLSGRFQSQFVALGTNIENAAVQPVSTQHFLLRRIYVGVKAQMSGGFTGYLNYDFAGSTFDQATISWKHSDLLTVDVGLRKVPFGYDEVFISSGSLKAIERSVVTRYFVESNNGRRLGAGSYRQGVFVGGRDVSGISYNVAITNPERDEIGLALPGGTPGAAGVGNNTSNNFSYWGNLGYDGVIGEGRGTYKFGVSAGYLPDQGGKVLGIGNDLQVYEGYGDVTFGNLNVAASYMTSKNKQGVSATQDANSWGYWVQPSYRLGVYELLARYSYIDSDGRGVATSDGIRSAPSGGTMNKLSEWTVGANWYIRGFDKSDVKLQLMYIYGESKDTITGGPAKATTQGIRSQLQVNF